MSPHRDEHLDLCAAYVVGHLDAQDRARLDEHLREGCDVCRDALAQFGHASVLLAHTVPAVSPSPSVRTRVLEMVRSEAAAGSREEAAPHAGERGPSVVPIRPRRRWVWAAAVGWAAAAVLAVTVGTFWETIVRLREEIQLRDQQVAELNGQLAVEHRWVAILGSPGVKVTEMTLTPQGAAALKGKAVYDAGTGRALVLFQNAFPPIGKDYQLWAIRGGQPVNLGVVRADASGFAVIPLEGVGDPKTTQAFAVSLEPKGGSPNPKGPSGPVVMVAPLSG